jgi:hypothetical protein
MLDCALHQESDEKDSVQCDGSEAGSSQQEECGSDTAYAYFISFYVLCSFLVSIIRYQSF